MKKVTLFLMGLILALGFAKAQDGPVFPTVSTSDDGPWYYIQVKGSDDSRKGLVMTAEGDNVFGRTKAPSDLNSLNARLWRIEEGEGENAGQYAIINKLTGKYLVTTMGSDKNGSLPVSGLSATLETYWAINDLTGGFQLEALTSIDASTPYLHQANNYAERAFTVMMTTSGFASSDDSNFTFIEYIDEGIVIAPESINFQSVAIGTGADDDPYGEAELSIFASVALGGNIQYTVSNNEDNTLDIQELVWSDDTGGTLGLYFFPAEAKEYNYTLTVTCGEKTVDVEITGVGIAQLPVELDAWYRIQFNLRTGFCLTDNGADKPAIASIYDNTDDGQLWKFTASGEEGKYNLVNKLGNGLTYRYEEKDENDAVTVTGRFLIDEGANDNTFSFELRKDGNWQIIWNEYEYEDEDEVGGIGYGTNINKTNNDSEFCAYKYNPDNGNSVVFIKGDEIIDIGLPEFSTATAPVWYRVQFYRTATKEGKENIAFRGSEIDANITQEEFVKDDMTFYWRFEGTWDNCKIINGEGGEFGFSENANVSINLKAENEGAAYTFEAFSSTSDWQLKAVEATSYAYLNDYSGSTVGGYSKNDAGARILLTKIEDESGINTPGQSTDSEIISSVYYTIQGAQLKGIPTTTGLYIQKNIHASGETSAKTIFIK